MIICCPPFPPSLPISLQLTNDSLPLISDTSVSIFAVFLFCAAQSTRDASGGQLSEIRWTRAPSRSIAGQCGRPGTTAAAAIVGEQCDEASSSLPNVGQVSSWRRIAAARRQQQQQQRS